MPDPFRLLVTGSRDWQDGDTVRLELLNVYSHASGPLVVVHGGAPGADRLARNWALAMARSGHPVTGERHAPDWDRYGRRAGYVRNEEMAALGADLCVAFVAPCGKPGCAARPRHDSHGTAHAIACARAAGIEVRRIEAVVHA